MLDILCPCSNTQYLELTETLKDYSDCKLTQLGYENVPSVSSQEAFMHRNIAGLNSVKRYVTFLDPLDTWQVDKHINLVRNTAVVDLLILLPKFFDFDVLRFREYVLGGEALPTGSFVIRQTAFEAIGGFREDMPHSASWDLLLRCVLSSNISMAIIAEASWQYYFNSNSIANNLPFSHREVITWRKQWLTQYVS